ncbi:MAG: hypothetical protein ACE5LG_07075 [Anaerolineae bacterium]
MSKGRVLLVGVGSAFLVSMMLLAAFSVGVYVGSKGWARGALSPAGPQQPPQQGFPDRRPALQGVVQGVTNEGLIVGTPQGPRLVFVNEDTKVQDREGEVDRERLQRGTPVAIFGQFSEDGRTLMAEVILILPPKP